MLSEKTPLLPGAGVENTNAKKIIAYLRNLTYLLIKTIIFGDSLKAGLDIYLESWQFDIQQAGAKNFDTRTISTIGAYLAILGSLTGYLAYRKIKNADINDKVNYIIYKITQAVGAFGLHAYLLRFFLFAYTETCRRAYQDGNAHDCTNLPGQPMALNTLCCIDAENTKDPHYPVISLNETVFIATAIASMETIWYAMKVFRYEFNKQSNVRRTSNLLSVTAAAVSYAITRFAFSEKLPLLYHTLIPISVYHLMHFLTSMPTIAMDIHDGKKGLILANGEDAKNGVCAALLTGFGGAALFHSAVFTYEVNFLKSLVARNIIQYGTATTLTLFIGYHIKNSRDLKDFIGRIGAYVLPKPLLRKLQILPPETSLLPVNIDNEAQPLQSNRMNKRRILSLLSGGALTFSAATLTVHFIQQAMPTQDIAKNWEARGLRFAAAITAYLAYAGASYGERLNLNDELNVTWPSFSDIATWTIMSIGLFKAIETLDDTNQMITLILLNILLASCLFGEVCTKKLKTWLGSSSNPSNEVAEISEPDNMSASFNWRKYCCSCDWKSSSRFLGWHRDNSARVANVINDNRQSSKFCY